MSFERIIPDLERLGARVAVAADADGRLVRATPQAEDGSRRALHAASMLRELQEAGGAAALGALDSCVVKGAGGISVTVLRAPLLVQAVLDPSESSAALERALGDWHPQLPEAQATEAAKRAAAEAFDLVSSLAVTPAQERPDPWRALRRTLVRAQLTDASALRESLGEDVAGGRPGAEALEPALRERAMDGLLEGIGSVLSGDALGGLRTLKEVASEEHGNLSFRWLGLHWSAIGAVQCNAAEAARWSARQALLLSRQLDVEAQAVSHWAAAEVLAAEGDGAKALDWAAQARVRFERLADPWGLGRVAFAEARILAVMGREDEAAQAARQAWVHDPAWDDPAVFLARRALLRGALDEADETLRMVGTAAAERIRLVAQAVRQGVLSQADAVELLEHLDAAPSAESAKALDRLAHAAPRLAVSREALAWMLLKAGRYADAGKHFTALAAARLPPAIRSSVMLGLGCVAHGQQAGERPEARLRAAVQAGENAPADPGATPVVAPLSATAAAQGAVFSGKLSVFAVPDLLEFLRGARRTGLLLCSAAAGTAALRFRDGRIAGAASPSTVGVGELLIRARKLSAVTLQSVLERQGKPARRDGVLGEVLVREGLVGVDDVRAALREQISLTVKEILAWREGEFAFNREEAEADADAAAEIPVEVDPQEVLLNVLKDMDEAARNRALS